MAGAYKFKCPYCKAPASCSAANGSTRCPKCGKRIDVKNAKPLKH